MRSPRPSGTPLRKGGNGFLNLFAAFVLIAVSCSSLRENPASSAGEQVKSPYIIYLVSKGLHTGLVIPVNEVSEERITAVKYFTHMEYIDFGWGEEEYYQHTGRKYCLGIRAVILPNSSVVRVQGFSAILEEVISWSDYTVQFNLSESEFERLCGYIEGSFSRDEDDALMEASRRRSGEIIYFRSVYYYCGLNTCNTWAARGLRDAGLGVSPLLVITAEDLYDEVKDAGIIIKKMNLSHLR